MGFYNPIYKYELFSSKTHISTPFTQDLYGIFLLTWTYFNDVNGGRNILINSQLKKNPFLWAATRKNETKLRKVTEKTWK